MQDGTFKEGEVGMEFKPRSANFIGAAEVRKSVTIVTLSNEANVERLQAAPQKSVTIVTPFTSVGP